MTRPSLPNAASTCIGALWQGSAAGIQASSIQGVPYSAMQHVPWVARSRQLCKQQQHHRRTAVYMKHDSLAMYASSALASHNQQPANSNGQCHTSFLSALQGAERQNKPSCRNNMQSHPAAVFTPAQTVPGTSHCVHMLKAAGPPMQHCELQ